MRISFTVDLAAGDFFVRPLEWVVEFIYSAIQLDFDIRVSRDKSGGYRVSHRANRHYHRWYFENYQNYKRWMDRRHFWRRITG